MNEPRSSSCTSLESIDQEVSKRLHFRPINAAPLTPPKNSPGNSNFYMQCFLLSNLYILNLILRRNCQASGDYCCQEFERTLWAGGGRK